MKFIFNRKICVIFTITIMFLFSNISVSAGDKIGLTAEEEEWVLENKDKIINIGVSNYSGSSFFVYNNNVSGYILEIVNLINKEIGLKIRVVPDNSWNVIFNNLKNGQNMLLSGANKTAERMEYMVFTEPILTYYYSVISSEEMNVRTLGDLENKRIGFVKSDIAIDLFKKYYDKIDAEIKEYDLQSDTILALKNAEIDAFIIEAGGIEKEFLINNPSLKKITNLNKVYSEMTISALKENKIIIDIINKFIKLHRADIENAVKIADIKYNHKLLNFSSEELRFMRDNKHIKIGISKDYLPFEYADRNGVEGIIPEVIKFLADNVGISFEVVVDDFDALYSMFEEGKIDMLNIAKTKERLEKFIFTDPIVEEIDMIYGNRDSQYVGDIYGLNDKRVAVVKGFYHKEMLEKNLTNYTLIETDSIEETIDFVSRKKVDYFIENPTVVEYYINALGYKDIVRKGATASDSFIYFALNKDKKTLANIINKAFTLMNYDLIREAGINNIPVIQTNKERKLSYFVIFLIIIIIFIILMLERSVRSYISVRDESIILKEREQLLYNDSLTGLYNRMYFNLIEDDLNSKENISFFMLDLNDLKSINDRLGHLTGDKYLKKFSEVLSDVFDDNIIIRMGGDEFLVISDIVDEEYAEKIMTILRTKLDVAYIKCNDTLMMGISFAIGFAYKESYQSVEEAIGLADKRMYDNKRSMK